MTAKKQSEKDRLKNRTLQACADGIIDSICTLASAPLFESNKHSDPVDPRDLS
jgi:hypothetical protein